MHIQQIETPSLSLLTFENKSVRVTIRNGAPWFVLADVCRVLEISNVGNAAARLDEDEKGIHSMDTLGGNQSQTIINESGLYSTILTSRKREAKAFKKWVTSEVLPSIRKHGGYIVAAPEETLEELALRTMKVLQATVDRQKAQLAIAEPKADALDRIATADGSLGLIEAAKALQVQPKAFVRYLAMNGWIYRRAGSKNWLGYQARTAAGDIEHKVHTAPMRDGTEVIHEQVKITPRGLTKLAKIIPNHGGISAAA